MLPQTTDNPARTVVHLDLDTFFISVERLRDKRLNDIPLLVGGSGNRGVVASCSYEARTFGIRSGMPMKLAKRLCPYATVISGDHEAYAQCSEDVTKILREQAPVFEKASIDEFYVDMTGMERYVGTEKWAHHLRDYVRVQTGLPMSFGLANNKTVAKVATNEAKPGTLAIPYGKEQPFLDPLLVRKLPMVGEKMTLFLNNMGVHKVRTLREIPREVLLRILGRNGNTLWQRAHGIDTTPVEPYNERKSMSTERTFPEDTINVTALRATITRMAEQLAFSLRSSNKLCACVTLKVRYADFNTVSRQARLPYTATDHVLIEKALELFELLYDRRQQVRLVGVAFSNLIQGGHQIDLFEDTEKNLRLYEAIDRVKARFGVRAVTRASALGGLGERGSKEEGVRIFGKA